MPVPSPHRPLTPAMVFQPTITLCTIVNNVVDVKNHGEHDDHDVLARRLVEHIVLRQYEYNTYGGTHLFAKYRGTLI